MKTQRLLHNVRHAPEFLSGHGRVSTDGFIERRVLLDEKQQVGDGSERIVDFVRNGCGQASGGGELLAFANGFFSVLALSYVEVHADHSNWAPLLVVVDASVRHHPSHRAIGADDAELVTVSWAFFCDAGGHSRLHGGVILWVDARTECLKGAV